MSERLKEALSLAVARIRKDSPAHSHDIPGNAPGHCHDVAGIWNADNGIMAGTPCDWCLKEWPAILAALNDAPAEEREEDEIRSEAVSHGYDIGRAAAIEEIAQYVEREWDHEIRVSGLPDAIRNFGNTAAPKEQP
jgi:hypothetical protein